MDELEVFLQESSVPIAIVTECFDITRYQVYHKIPLNINTRRDKCLSRKDGGLVCILAATSHPNC